MTAVDGTTVNAIDGAHSNFTQRGRLHGLDFARGMACLSMPIFHGVYNLFALGLIDSNWTKLPFWVVYQKLGLGTFVLVSGMAFVVSTSNSVHWNRLAKRVLKLAGLASLITLATYYVMPHNYIRFGVLHFFATTIILALMVRPLKRWLLLPGAIIVGMGVYIGRGGLFPEAWLYITGLMSERPPSADYIPLVPWFGVFMIGMGLAHWLTVPAQYRPPPTWMKPVIWLGKHSLSFYILHQPILLGGMWVLAWAIK